MIFTDLDIEEKRDIIDFVSGKIGYNPDIIEKDWWVTAVLEALFKLPYAPSLSFKGGTSLSKCWGLINRMSEDIDIGLNREYLGLTGDISRNQVNDRLRRASCSFVRNQLKDDIQCTLENLGIKRDLFNVTVNVTPVSTTDPETLFIEYKSVLSPGDYIVPRVKVEVSGRSMSEPVKTISINSYIGENFSHPILSCHPVKVNAVAPQRTFLEKLFLLHEEFSKPSSEIRVERMSRHLYDIDQILDTHIGTEALNDSSLYDSVIEHRRKFIGLKGFNYDSLRKSSLCFIPLGKVRQQWAEDYRRTVESLVLGNARTFDEVMARLEGLNMKINAENRL